MRTHLFAIQKRYHIAHVFVFIIILIGLRDSRSIYAADVEYRPQIDDVYPSGDYDKVFDKLDEMQMQILESMSNSSDENNSLIYFFAIVSAIALISIALLIFVLISKFFNKKDHKESAHTPEINELLNEIYELVKRHKERLSIHDSLSGDLKILIKKIERYCNDNPSNKDLNKLLCEVKEMIDIHNGKEMNDEQIKSITEKISSLLIEGIKPLLENIAKHHEDLKLNNRFLQHIRDKLGYEEFGKELTHFTARDHKAKR